MAERTTMKALRTFRGRPGEGNSPDEKNDPRNSMIHAGREFIPANVNRGDDLERRGMAVWVHSLARPIRDDRISNADEGADPRTPDQNRGGSRRASSEHEVKVGAEDAAKAASDPLADESSRPGGQTGAATRSSSSAPDQASKTSRSAKDEDESVSSRSTSRGGARRGATSSTPATGGGGRSGKGARRTKG